MRSLFKWFWVAVNDVESHFRSVTDMSRSTKTLKGIQVPGSISFKKLPKGPWRITSSLFKMVVEFSHEKYTCGGENGSRTVSSRCERLCKPCTQRWAISGNSSILNGKPQNIQLEESLILWKWKEEQRAHSSVSSRFAGGLRLGISGYVQKINFHRTSWGILLF